MAEVFCG